MRKFQTYILVAAVACLASCKEKEETPKVIYDSKPEKVVTKPDSSQIKIADLPIHMEGTKYLIHAIGDVRVYDGNSRTYGSSKTNSVSYAISNYNRFELTGYFENLKFQHIDSTALKPLTDKKIQMQTVTFLNTISDKTKKQILVYSLVDMDTNKDGKLDANDIKCLYISEINGKHFQKLSEDYRELIDWNIVEAQNRLYYRTIEDINKNGAFDKNDAVHYYYVELLSPDWKTEKYDPIGNGNGA
ncbi:hypothetical protein H9W95_08075 [Flavobacterium lindanitolerans]|nr:hypothetical protein [Flavobacterium lindanitolerans]